MTDDATPGNVRLNAGLGPNAPLVERLRTYPADPLLCDDYSAAMLEAADELERLREALVEIRDRIKDHPAYADLTMEQEIDEGGDTAEFSYLARVADDALGA